MPPSEIVSSATEQPAPTPRGIGQIVYTILADAVDKAGNAQNDYDQTIVNAVVRYAPEKFPGALPEIIIVLDRHNRAFRLVVHDFTQQTFGGSLP
jgi:hypothetical protein